jgi:ketosteroid isomerase-like protein
MPSSRSIIALLTMSLAIPGAHFAIADEVEGEVKSAYVAWDEAFNKKDAKAIAGFYTDDAYLLPPSHKVIEGPAGIADFFDGLISRGVTDHKLEMIEADGDGKLVYGAAKWSVTGKDDKGQPATFSGVATHIFEKQPDGSLKLKLHTFN